MDKKISEGSKQNFMMMADAILLPSSLWIAVALRYGDLYKDVMAFWWLFLVASITGVLALYRFGVYRAVVRYIGPSSLISIVQSMTVAAIMVSLLAYLAKIDGFPRSAPIIFWFISILLVGGGRILVRASFYGLSAKFLTKTPVAVYGAGESGASLAITLLNSSDMMPVAFIDDNKKLRNQIIRGIRVYHSADIEEIVDNLAIEQVLLAVPAATAQQRSDILNRLATLPILVKTVPDFNELIRGDALVGEVREVDIADLLGRDTVPPDPELLEKSVAGKSVLITGAGGTIGSELARIIVKLNPIRIVLLDHSEYSLYKIEQQLISLDVTSCEVVAILGTILNQSHLDVVMHRYEVQTIYHAAAFKHVPMVEKNIVEGIRNNVLGTWRLVNAAVKYQVEEFVLISSDKAVRPTNVMGATKRLAELIVQGFSEKASTTRLCMVRFGNVLRSSGSVVPLFEKQILSGGPVTVTHKDATRYFMTASEAAELVVQAGSLSQGGELYVLDMGDPVKMNDLAVKMVHLHGKRISMDETVQGDSSNGLINIEYIGLRPGEKLHEELIIGSNTSGTQHPKIMMADEEFLSFDKIVGLMLTIEKACESFNQDELIEVLESVVSGYSKAKVATNMMETTRLEISDKGVEPRTGVVLPIRRNKD